MLLVVVFFCLGHNALQRLENWNVFVVEISNAIQRMSVDQLTYCNNKPSVTHFSYLLSVWGNSPHPFCTPSQRPIAPTCRLAGGLQFVSSVVFNSISSRVTAFSLCLRFVAIGITLVHQALCCAVHIRLGSVRSLNSENRKEEKN